MALQIRFGSVNLPSTFAPLDDSLSRDIQPAKLPRTDGSRVIQGYAAEKIIPIAGSLIKGPISNISPYSDLRSAIDALRAQLSGVENLYFFDDRYYRDVQARSVGVSFVEKRIESIANIDIEFVTGDPFKYYHSETSDIWMAPSGSKVITTLGNAYSLPIYKFTSGSATINWSFTNNTTGKSFTLSGVISPGDIIEVDVREKTVVIGAADNMALFEGQFPELASGANSLTIALTVGTISKLETLWRDRWYG